MTDRVCKNCNRPLNDKDGEYCPHCTAKRAGKIGKTGGIISAIGATLLAIVVLLVKNKKS